jgi:hypothetical protein
MRSRIGAEFLGAMACGALALAAPALALARAAAPPQADEQLVPTGSLAYTWQAMPQLGCAKENLCGVDGAVTIDVQSGTYSQQKGFPSTLDLDVTATARTQGPGSGTSCVDVLGAPFIELSGPSRGHRSGEDFGGSGLSSGRCPGPLIEDLNRLPFRFRKVGHRHPSFEIRGTRTESAGPYTVTLRSSLVMRPGTNGESSTSGFSIGTSRHQRSPLFEVLTLRYRLASVTGTPVASFRAAPGPFCDTLDECGASGTVSLTPLQRGKPLVITASRMVPRRVGRAQALRELRTGHVATFGQTSLAVSVHETIGGGQTGSCSDMRSRPVSLLMVVNGRRGLVQLADDSLDTLRTYCPGPLEGDLSSEGGPLVLGSIHAAELGRRFLTLNLVPTRPSSDQAYISHWSGAMSFHLVRTGFSIRTSREQGP